MIKMKYRYRSLLQQRLMLIWACLFFSTFLACDEPGKHGSHFYSNLLYETEFNFNDDDVMEIISITSTAEEERLVITRKNGDYRTLLSIPFRVFSHNERNSDIPEARIIQNITKVEPHSVFVEYYARHLNDELSRHFMVFSATVSGRIQRTFDSQNYLQSLPADSEYSQVSLEFSDPIRMQLHSAEGHTLERLLRFNGLAYIATEPESSLPVLEHIEREADNSLSMSFAETTLPLHLEFILSSDMNPAISGNYFHLHSQADGDYIIYTVQYVPEEMNSHFETDQSAVRSEQTSAAELKIKFEEQFREVLPLKIGHNLGDLRRFTLDLREQ